MSQSLLRLCMRKAAENIGLYRDNLYLLPSDLQLGIAEILLEQRPETVGRGLEILCQTIWKPAALKLGGVPFLNVRGMMHLSCMSCSLVKLDLSSCGDWLYNVSFLPGLVRLECLSLRNCWRLSGSCINFIKELPNLRCLDLENIQITDDWASSFIPGMRNLRSLNMSGTFVSDNFVEALTYRIRLESWAAKQQAVGHSVFVDWVLQHNSWWYQVLEITVLRLQNTKITERALQFLSDLTQIKLLDVRSTDLPGRSLQHIKAKHALLSLPNNSKILGKTNSILLSVLQGSCGCSSEAYVLNKGKSLDCLNDLEKNYILRLLQEACRIGH